MSRSQHLALGVSRITRARESAGLSQAELAVRAGVSRAAISSMEIGAASPSVHAALAVARALGCRVEDLFGHAKEPVSSEPQWAWQPRGQVARFWEAEVGDRRWMFPIESPTLHSAAHDGVWRDGAVHLRTGLAKQSLVLACCDPAAGLLAAEYARVSGFRLIVLLRGGAAALGLLKRGVVHVAGLHRATEEHPDLNIETVRTKLGKGYRLLRAAAWQAGMAVKTTERTRSVQTLLRKRLRWALREPGSSARECLDNLSGSRQLPGRVVEGHTAVAQVVRSGWADAGVCVKLTAEEAGLNFIPVRTELLDFCFPSALARDPRVSALVRLLRSRTHRQLISELPGYDARETGAVEQT